MTTKSIKINNSLLSRDELQLQLETSQDALTDVIAELRKAREQIKKLAPTIASSTPEKFWDDVKRQHAEKGKGIKINKTREQLSRTKKINKLARDWADFVGGFKQAQKVVEEAYKLGFNDAQDSYFNRF